MSKRDYGFPLAMLATAFIGIAATFLILWMMSWFTSKDEQAYKSPPCSAYKETLVKDVPARCFEGFRP